MSNVQPISANSRVIIIGAGPAGLTAAAELVEISCSVVIVERDPHYVGGLARTVRYKGYRFDIGGHRFFSKSGEIVNWWKKQLPNDFISVNRMSRIFYRGKFFDYPLKVSNALFGLGVFTSAGCLISFLWARLFPIRPEKSFADWVTNRFGAKLFSIFFKTYTEKVWGMSCTQISADWAAQRIKGLSLFKAVWNALFPQKRDSSQVVKTLIDRFQYPRLGPGMMWEKTRDELVKQGAEFHMGEEVVRINHNGLRVTSVVSGNGVREALQHDGDSFIVSMPLRDCVLAFDPPLPSAVREAAGRLQYRDFLTVAMMINRVQLFPDNWIYVHDPSVRLGRIQNFNNWSEDLVPEKNTSCLGLEYFCFAGDGLWTMSDEALIQLGSQELGKLGLVRPDEIIDGCVVRMEKAYPVYTTGYQNDVRIISDKLAKLQNFQVIGRNGMHKYNNQDHSMMTALLAARNLTGGRYDLWKVNTDAEYHEEVEEHREATGRLVPNRI